MMGELAVVPIGKVSKLVTIQNTKYKTLAVFSSGWRGLEIPRQVRSGGTHKLRNSANTTARLGQTLARPNMRFSALSILIVY